MLAIATVKYYAYHGHGLSLLALAKGMSTLFAKNGFSRPSLKVLRDLLSEEVEAVPAESEVS